MRKSVWSEETNINEFKKLEAKTPDDEHQICVEQAENEYMITICI